MDRFLVPKNTPATSLVEKVRAAMHLHLVCNRRKRPTGPWLKMSQSDQRDISLYFLRHGMPTLPLPLPPCFSCLFFVQVTGLPS